MRNDHNLEVLSDALNAVLLAGDFDTCADPRAFVRKENALVDAAIECGMKHDHTHPREWASVTVAYWLSKPITGLWAGSGYARNYSMPSLGEAA